MTSYVTNVTDSDYKGVLSFVLSFNLPLCILAIAICSIVLTYYWKNRGTITNKLFLLITSADLITCIGHFAAMLHVILLFLDAIPDGLSDMCVAIYIMFTLLGSTISAHLNIILAVLRTVKLSFPFYRVKVEAVKTAISIIVFILVLLTAPTVWGVFYTRTHPDLQGKPWFELWVSLALVSVGADVNVFIKTVCHLHISETVSWVIQDFVLAVVYLCPLGIVLTCMAVQLAVTMFRYRARDPNDPVVTSWSHANTTVAILTTTFTICYSGTAVVQIYYDIHDGEGNGTFPHWEYIWEFMTSTTLPLFNALLTPLILLIRGREMRRNVLMMIWRPCRNTGTYEVLT